MKALYKYRFVLFGVFALFAMLWITCGTSQARGPVPTATPMPTATPTPTPEGWKPEETYQPTSTEKVRQIWQSLYADYESGYAGHELDNWMDTKEAILALTKDADREAILKEWPKDVKLQIIDAKYTFRELEAVGFEIDTTWYYAFERKGEESIVIGTGINVRENYVTVCIDRTAPTRVQKKVISDLFERYGDCIRIDSSMSAEELRELESELVVDDYYLIDSIFSDSSKAINKNYYDYKPNDSLLTFTAYTNNRGAYKVMSRGAVIALAAGLAAAILVFAFVLRRQAMQVRVTADGREVAGGEPYSDAELERLARAAQEDVSEEGRNRIFAAYERETRGN